jgi:hypothetical protein
MKPPPCSDADLGRIQLQEAVGTGLGRLSPRKTRRRLPFLASKPSRNLGGGHSSIQN